MKTNFDSLFYSLRTSEKNTDKIVTPLLSLFFAQQLKILKKGNATTKFNMLKGTVDSLLESFTELKRVLEAPDSKFLITSLKLEADELLLNVMNNCASNYIKKQFAPHIERNLAEINDALSLNIDTYELFDKFGDWQIVYYVLREIYINTMRENSDSDPLLILERFISTYSVIIQFDEKKEKWFYRFTDTSMELSTDYEIHECDDLLSLLDELKAIVLPSLMQRLKTRDTYGFPFYESLPPEKDVDFELIQNMNASQLYEYLSQYNSVIINIMELKYLYFLLSYRQLGFDGAVPAVKTKRWITYNFAMDDDLDIRKDIVFDKFRISPDNVPGNDDLILS